MEYSSSQIRLSSVVRGLAYWHDYMFKVSRYEGNTYVLDATM